MEHNVGLDTLGIKITLRLLQGGLQTGLTSREVCFEKKSQQLIW